MLWETGYFNNTQLTHPIGIFLVMWSFCGSNRSEWVARKLSTCQLLTFPTALFHLSFFYIFSYFKFFLYLSVTAVKARLFVIGLPLSKRDKLIHFSRLKQVTTTTGKSIQRKIQYLIQNGKLNVTVQNHLKVLSWDSKDKENKKEHLEHWRIKWLEGKNSYHPQRKG